jgi:predicted RNA binding protein YcfA (HicA-like mRNA interferase family)
MDRSGRKRAFQPFRGRLGNYWQYGKRLEILGSQTSWANRMAPIGYHPRLSAAMTKIEKLYARLVANRRSIPFRDFRRILEAFGFSLDRINGSHHIFKHPAVSRALSVQPRADEAKPYQIDQFLDIVEEFGLEMKK